MTDKNANDAVIVSAVRTAVGKAPRGTLRETRPDDMAAAVLIAAFERAPGIDADAIDDVILGCAMPEGPQGLNVARMASLRAGFPHAVPGMTVNRFCASGLQAIAQAADRIRTGGATAILAGGTESMSLVPMGGAQVRPNPRLVLEQPHAYIGMGNTAEIVAEQYGITRETQDAFALKSHEKALAAIAAGKFADEIIALDVVSKRPGPRGESLETRVTFDTDEGPRADTSLDALAKLRPAFNVRGTVTAGNSSQMSDGAAAALVTSRARAEQAGMTPLGVLRDFVVVGVAPEVMGIGPAVAIPALLERNGLTIGDIDLFEVNEAFASQAVHCARELVIPRDKLNVNGGGIALGHPLGATGAKLTATLLHEMARRDGRFGVVSMCVGGGMGAAGLFERES